MVSALTEAQLETLFEQLWQGDAVTAKKELDKVFEKRKLSFGVVTENLIYNDDLEENCLAVSTVQVHGTKVHALMNTGATSSVTSPKLVRKLSLKQEYISKAATVEQATNWRWLESLLASQWC